MSNAKDNEFFLPYPQGKTQQKLLGARLILIRGLPGSGKSTFANHLVDWLEEFHATKAYHWEADMWMLNANGEYEYRQEWLAKAHGDCQTAARLTVTSNRIAIVSNTFVRLWELQPYLAITQHCVVLKMSNAYGSNHNVPQDAMERMASKWENFEGEIDASNW